MSRRVLSPTAADVRHDRDNLVLLLPSQALPRVAEAFRPDFHEADPGAEHEGASCALCRDGAVEVVPALRDGQLGPGLRNEAFEVVLDEALPLVALHGFLLHVHGRTQHVGVGDVQLLLQHHCAVLRLCPELQEPCTAEVHIRVALVPLPRVYGPESPVAGGVAQEAVDGVRAAEEHALAVMVRRRPCVRGAVLVVLPADEAP